MSGSCIGYCGIRQLHWFHCPVFWIKIDVKCPGGGELSEPQCLWLWLEPTFVTRTKLLARAQLPRTPFIAAYNKISSSSQSERGYRPLSKSRLACVICSARICCFLHLVPLLTAMSLNSLPSKIPELKQNEIENLHTLAAAWAGLNGLVVMRATGIQVAPISLLPMPFPRRVYAQVKEVMVSRNRGILSVIFPLTSWCCSSISTTWYTQLVWTTNS